MSRRTVVELRKAFAVLQRNACYNVSRDVWLAAVQRLLPKHGKATASQWLSAAERAKVKCPRCAGTGLYQWGACVNGKMTHSAPCFRCEGKGVQGQADFTRNWGYDQHRKVA